MFTILLKILILRDLQQKHKYSYLLICLEMRYACCLSYVFCLSNLATKNKSPVMQYSNHGTSFLRKYKRFRWSFFNFYLNIKTVLQKWLRTNINLPKIRRKLRKWNGNMNFFVFKPTFLSKSNSFLFSTNFYAIH